MGGRGSVTFRVPSEAPLPAVILAPTSAGIQEHCGKMGLFWHTVVFVRMIESKPLGSKLSVTYVSGREDGRSPVVLAVFVEGLVPGWRMAVSESFREALDIRFTPRIAGDVKEMIWTQGQCFAFREGDTLHAASGAPRRVTIQVERASDACFVERESSTSDQTLQLRTVDLSKDKGKTKAEEFHGVQILEKRYSPGSVSLTIYESDPSGEHLRERHRAMTTQVDFVSFLQTGLLRTTEKTVLDVFAPTNSA